jgi:hypothetical protein
LDLEYSDVHDAVEVAIQEGEAIIYLTGFSKEQIIHFTNK